MDFVQFCFRSSKDSFTRSSDFAIKLAGLEDRNFFLFSKMHLLNAKSCRKIRHVKLCLHWRSSRAILH
jgi:hypothetical protein